jgi:hypothetical protein
MRYWPAWVLVALVYALGQFVRALFWVVRAISAIFGPSERKKP